MENKKKKLFIYALDCATPQLIFDKYRNELPFISKIMKEGSFGLLRSTDPAITIPAWMSMFTGKDPGQLGFYGFTDRSDYSYENIHIVNSNDVICDTVWDILSKNNLKSIVIGIPPTYPPKPLKGILIADFLTPDKSLPFTYPKNIQEEINKIAGGDYIIDVENFMIEDHKKLLRHIYDMTEKRFEVINAFIKNKEWDLFIAMEIGLDRLHHGFWRFCFQDHFMYKKGNEFEGCIRDYYKFIDKKLEETYSLFKDSAEFMIVSDHGAKGSQGSFFLNDWLIRNGYLFLKDNSLKQDRLSLDNVDWKKTRVWSKGGYYGRMFFNIKGREPMGIVLNEEIPALTKEIRQKLSFIKNDDLKEIKSDVLQPREIYKEINNIPPDLLFYCGNLDWRISDAVGKENLFSKEDNFGADNANHDFNGIVVNSWKSKKKDLNICEIAPIVLDFFKLKNNE